MTKIIDKASMLTIREKFKNIQKLSLVSVAFIAAYFTTITVYANKPIVTGSKIDTESILLCQIISTSLKSKAINVHDKCGTGVTQVVRKALLGGEIDLYPEYTGNAQYIIEGFNYQAKNSEDLYQKIAATDLAENKIAWLKPAPANNTFVLAVRQDFSKQHHIKTVDDLAQYINAGKPAKLIASYEFVTREDGLKAFEKQYGFKLKPRQLIMIPGGNTAQTETALARNANNINIAMAYSTDGQIAALGLLGLIDSKGAQQEYQPAVTIRENILKQYPRIQSILEPIFKKLDTETLSQLNGKIVVDGLNSQRVAEQYLKDIGVTQ